MLRFAVLLLALLFAGSAFGQQTDDLQARTFKYFMTRANNGDMNAQFIIGNRYASGQGVKRDLDKAYTWYAKAAEQGHEVAKEKLERRNRAAQEAEKAVQQAAAAAQAEKVVKPVKKPPAKVSQPPVTVARAPAKKPATLGINAMNLVLSGTWLRNQQAAEYLPSAKTSCVKASASNIVCFSKEFGTDVGNSALTYTVKSTLSDFDNDGRFTIKYLYNVLEIDKKKDAAKDDHGPADIALKQGWQDPGSVLQCRANDKRRVTCSRGNKYTLHFSKI